MDTKKMRARSPLLPDPGDEISVGYALRRAMTPNELGAGGFIARPLE